MDQDPQDNQSSTNNSYQPQYHWLSPLLDIQTGFFNPETGLNPEDNPISGIDPELFAARATNTSAMVGPSTHTDLRNGIDRAVHPEKGLLSYKDVQHQRTAAIPVATLEQLPNEILEQICE